MIKDLDMSKTEKSDIINNSDLSTKTFNAIRNDKSNNKVFIKDIIFNK